jgi:hypothetical protein
MAILLAVAGVIGFGLGTWLGTATRTSPVAAKVATPPISSEAPSPSTTTSPAPTADPTESAAPSQAPSATPEVIFSIKGTKHEVTDSFEAKPGWQIQWQIEGNAIAVAVSGDPNLGVVINQKGPSSGVAGIAEGGRFALNIVATGPWKVTVIEGEEPAAT